MQFITAKFVLVGVVAVIIMIVSNASYSTAFIARPRRSDTAAEDSSDADISGGAAPGNAKSAQQILSLLQRKDYENVLEKLMGKMAERQQKERLAKCMAVFKSLPICTDSTGFYVWARMAAKQIMDAPTGVTPLQQ